jgi:hypothetical protein
LDHAGMTRRTSTSKRTVPASTLAESGLLGVGALLVATFLDRPASRNSPDRSRKKARRERRRATSLPFVRPLVIDSLAERADQRDGQRDSQRDVIGVPSSLLTE